MTIGVQHCLDFVQRIRHVGIGRHRRRDERDEKYYWIDEGMNLDVESEAVMESNGSWDVTMYCKRTETQDK